MKFSFEQIGQVQVDGETHNLSLPTPFNHPSGRILLFYCRRDEQNRSHIYVGRWDPKLPTKITESKLVLSPGPEGSFDQDGCGIGSVVYHRGRFHLYYMGWKLGTDVPWTNKIGLALAGEDLVFDKLQVNPIVGSIGVDSFNVSYPFVMKRGDVWHMWYGSNLSWNGGIEGMQHVIRHRTSKDGLEWPEKIDECAPLAPGEKGLSRPWVIFEDNRYLVYHSVKRDNYHLELMIGDGPDKFERNGQRIRFSRPMSDWDNVEQEYPALVTTESKEVFLFYCGNKYGATGFGVARGN